MTIFPTNIDIDNLIAETTQEYTELPMFKEYAWDFNNNDFIYLNGKNIILEGNEALKVWVYKVLKTSRYKYLAYTWDYGHEFDTLIGQRYSKEYIQSEAERILKDCLLINPYILELTNIIARLEDRTLHVDFIANTVYGEVMISV